MGWIQELKAKINAKVSHFFLLYLNVNDFVHYEDSLRQLDEYLFYSGIADGRSYEAGFVVYFNRGIGIQFTSKEKFDKFLAFIEESGTGSSKDFYRLRNSVGYMLSLFNELLRISWDSEDKKIVKALENHFGKDYKKNIGKPFFSAIIQYAETIAPPNSASHGSEDRNALVAFQVWAKDSKIRKANNLVILIAESLSAVAPALRLEANDIISVKIPLPDYPERLLTVQKIREKLRLPKSSLSDEALADLSAGLTNKIISNLLLQFNKENSQITAEDVFKAKKKFLEDQANGLLEIVKPVWGIEAIGSLEEHKIYINEVVKAMKDKNTAAAPMGVLLLGPPGVGKTVFAEALAHEAGIPMLRMKNIREMWVGQSERNLDFVLELIKAYAPVIIFIDEIDQHFQARGKVFHGDSGVSSRMQAKIFEFMSDTNFRGKVLWIAASNRPELLDQAMLREGRFDDKIPFFPPTADDRGKILKAILRKKESQALANNSSFNWDLDKDFIEKFGWMAHCHYHKEEGLINCDEKDHLYGQDSKNEVTFTGAEIEAIVSKAYMIAQRKGSSLNQSCLQEALGDFVPNRDLDVFDEMVDLALKYCNSERFIPEKWKERARQLRRRKPGPNKIDLG